MKHNLIMILLDGVRQDRLHLSEELSIINEQGVHFSNMVTSAPYTIAAIHSIMSGTYPTKNGVDSYYNMFKFKKNSFKTLSEYLKDQGYYTCADTGNESILPKQGFDKITIHNEYKDNLTKIHKEIIKETAKEGSNNPFFIFYQYDKIHTDAIINIAKKYDDFSEEYFDNKEKNIKRYDDCLKKTGIYAKNIMDFLKAERFLEKTIVVFFSDHGISNGEKIGEKMYGSFLYDYTIKTFLTIIHPKFNNKVINQQIRSIDLMPTVLDLLSIPLDNNYEQIQGRSLIPFINNNEFADRIAFCETGGLKGPWPSPNKPNVKAIRYKNWKLIYNETPDNWELYNLLKDPNEYHNLSGHDLEIQNELKKHLHRIIQENKEDKINKKELILDFTNIKI